MSQAQQRLFQQTSTIRSLQEENEQLHRELRHAQVDSEIVARLFSSITEQSESKEHRPNDSSSGGGGFVSAADASQATKEPQQNYSRAATGAEQQSAYPPSPSRQAQFGHAAT